MSFSGEKAVKATRKRHRCDGCRQLIEIGGPAIRWAGLTEGDFASVIYHPECRAAEIEMNIDMMGHRYGDDWAALAEIEDEDRPWLVERHPLAAQRLGVAALSPSPDPSNTQAQKMGEGS